MTEPPDAPLAGTESEHLTAMLDRLRWTFRWKADGLDVDELRFQLPSSGLSIGGLLKHLALVEDDVFAWRIAGARPETFTLVPDGTDAEEWQFTVGPEESAEEVYAIWDRAAARSQERLHAIVAGGGLDEPGDAEFRDVHPSKRRHVCDLIEEYGRHTGHADLLREAIDGRVGEDAPEDWRPST